MNAIVADATGAFITRTGRLRSVGDGDSEAARVIAQHVIVDAQIQPARVAGAKWALINADEEVVLTFADPADECSGRALGQRTVGIGGGVAFAFRPITSIGTPACLALGREVNLLSAAHVHTGVGPRVASRDNHLTLAHP